MIHKKNEVLSLDSAGEIVEVLITYDYSSWSDIPADRHPDDPNQTEEPYFEITVKKVELVVFGHGQDVTHQAMKNASLEKRIRETILVHLSTQ